MIQQGNINIKNWYYDRENGMEVKQKKDEVYYKLPAENVYISLVKLFIQFIEIRPMIASMEHTSQGKIK